MVEVSDESLTEPNKLSGSNEASEKDPKETIIEVEITDEMNRSEQASVKKHVCENINITLTKLRPEAPPFLPERIMTLLKGHQEVVADLITDSTIQNEECYFTDMNLQQSGQIASEHDIDIQHLREPDKKDIGLKPFSLVSNVSRSTRKSQASEIGTEKADKEGGSSGVSPPGRLPATESRHLLNTIARYLQDNPKQVAVKFFISLTVIIVLLAFVILRLF